MKIISPMLIVLIATFVGCQGSDISNETNGSLETTQEEYDWWNPTNALTRANSDIQSGEIKIYYVGGYAPLPAGINREDRKLIENYPTDYSGAGCVIFDEKLRELQEEYGLIYNQRVLEWIKENANQTNTITPVNDWSRKSTCTLCNIETIQTKHGYTVDGTLWKGHACACEGWQCSGCRGITEQNEHGCCD